MTVSEKQNDTGRVTGSPAASRWGPKLFWGVLVLVLVFFWWLLVYSHGVEMHHG